MSQLSIRRYLLPLFLGILGLFLLARVTFSNATILLPDDLDVLVGVTLLGVAMVVAIHTLVRLSMSYLRMLSVRGARQETLAEHARFLRRLDHELKNPLTAIQAGLKTLSLTSLDRQQQAVIDTLQTETLRLHRLVVDLRKLAELETQPLNFTSLEIESFIRNLVLVERERFEAGERHLVAELQLAHSRWVVDEDLLALAVHNLLDNAFKYTRPQGTITLGVATETELLIQVSDSGEGISATSLPHVWEELYRGEQRERIPGSGTGLALVKAIVERHDGRVAIQSTPGSGTTVSLRLPFRTP